MSDVAQDTARCGSAPVDWEAFQYLQRKAKRELSASRLNAIDRALDDLLANPDRAASGRRLAMNVLGSARKKIALAKETTLPPDYENTAIHASVEFIPAKDARAAGDSLVRAFSSLRPQERRALIHMAIPDAGVRPRGVKDRRCRALRKAARERLRRRDVREDFGIVWAVQDNHPDILMSVARRVLASAVSG